MVVFWSIFDVVPGVVVVVVVTSWFITDVVPVVVVVVVVAVVVVFVPWLISGTVPGVVVVGVLEGFVGTNSGLLMSAIRINMNYWKIKNTFKKN